MLHAAIKSRLYVIYGGPCIIDACAGAFHDLPHWAAAGCRHVLAIERDTHQIEEGNARISGFNDDVDVGVAQLDLSVPIEWMSVNLPTKANAVFCHFAVHYFLESTETALKFLDNIIPLMADGARFVLTYMRGDAVRREAPICILNDDGEEELNVEILADGKSMRVRVASIGKPHVEWLVDLNELRGIFASRGLVFLGTLPFQDLDEFQRHEMTVNEREMSRLYEIAVFMKKSIIRVETPLNRLVNKFLCAARASDTTFRFLSANDLVSNRSVFLRWKFAADRFISKCKTDPGWGVRQIGEGLLRFDRSRFASLTPPSKALFVRVGGDIDDVEEYDVYDSYSRASSPFGTRTYSDHSDYGEYRF